MGKRIQYTKITPLPSNIPRQLALDMLRSHGEVISLNPLVTGHKPIQAPREAAADEFFAQWYEITEIITWGFGLKKKISFKGVFYDLPNGLQTHTYAPMGVDLRNKWTVRGNQPGEPREPRELGVETPLEGLYLREDVEIVCNVALTSFVKKEMKAAAGVMVDRMTRKAELLDEGVLHAMFEDGKLKTTNPNVQNMGDLSKRDTGIQSPAPTSPCMSPKHAPSEYGETKYTTYRDLVNRRESHRNSHYLPAYQQEGYRGPDDHSRQGSQAYGGADKSTYVPYNPDPAPGPVEVEGSYYHPQQQTPNPNITSTIPAFHAELADTSVPSPPQQQQQDAKPAPLRPYRNSTQQPISSPQPSPGLPPRTNSQQPISSPQPSPGLPQKHPHRASNASYTSPNIPPAPKRESVGSTTNSGYAITNPDEGFYSRKPSQRSASTTTDQNLANRVQGLGINEEREESQSQSQVDPSQFGSKSAVLSKCPVCGNFEGDEAAVNHHVEKHFS